MPREGTAVTWAETGVRGAGPGARLTRGLRVALYHQLHTTDSHEGVRDK